LAELLGNASEVLRALVVACQRALLLVLLLEAPGAREQLTEEIVAFNDRTHIGVVVHELLELDNEAGFLVVMSVETFKEVDPCLVLSQPSIDDDGVLAGVVSLLKVTDVNSALKLVINRLKSHLDNLETMLGQTSPHHIEELIIADCVILILVENVEE